MTLRRHCPLRLRTNFVVSLCVDDVEALSGDECTVNQTGPCVGCTKPGVRGGICFECRFIVNNATCARCDTKLFSYEAGNGVVLKDCSGALISVTQMKELVRVHQHIECEKMNCLFCGMRNVSVLHTMSCMQTTRARLSH